MGFPDEFISVNHVREITNQFYTLEGFDNLIKRIITTKDMVEKIKIIDEIVYDGYTSSQVIESIINWSLKNNSLNCKQL
jgi:hypothetical protein